MTDKEALRVSEWRKNHKSYLVVSHGHNRILGFFDRLDDATEFLNSQSRYDTCEIYTSVNNDKETLHTTG